MSVCDFCSSPAPAWRYPADTFHDLFGSRSVEDWLACEACHRLIQSGDRSALARRSLDAPGVRMAVGVLGRVLALDYCRDLHARFWRARRGAPYRIAVSGTLVMRHDPSAIWMVVVASTERRRLVMCQESGSPVARSRNSSVRNELISESLCLVFAGSLPYLCSCRLGASLLPRNESALGSALF